VKLPSTRRGTMKIKHSLLISLSFLVVVVACDAKKSLIQKMLGKAKRGEDTGEYWLGGTAKQKLYNVISYDVMSERPLGPAISTKSD
jgi:hypothetical protein